MSAPSTTVLGTKSFLEGIQANQTFVLVAVLVGLHLLLIVTVLACLWRQTPKKTSLNRSFLDDHREEFKRTIRKTD